jgi:hypothetical protein
VVAYATDAGRGFGGSCIGLTFDQLLCTLELFALSRNRKGMPKRVSTW